MLGLYIWTVEAFPFPYSSIEPRKINPTTGVGNSDPSRFTFIVTYALKFGVSRLFLIPMH